MKVTMQNVAELAKVDKATVSRVIRGDARISEKTRNKVMKAVRELNYRPDLNARHLSTNKSGFIGVVVRDFNMEWFAPFIAGIDRSLSNTEYDLIVKCTDGDEKRALREMSKLYDRNVEGIIWSDSSTIPDKIQKPLITLGFKHKRGISILSKGEKLIPTFEIGAVTGRLIQKLVAGKKISVKDIYIENDSNIE